MKKNFLIILCLLFSFETWSQANLLRDKSWECNISDNGCLERIVFRKEGYNDTIPIFYKER